MFVVAGVTGHTGQAAATRLLELGKPVRVIVRNPEQGAAWTARGAEVAVASLDDVATLTAALRSAEGAYLLNPPQYQAASLVEAQCATADAIAAAVKASGVGRVVFLSSVGAERSSGTGPIVTLHHAEAVLTATGVPVTFLRAPYFIENWASVLPLARAQGILPSFLPSDLALVSASARDIGRIGAEALVRPHTGIRLIEIAGPETTSPRMVAEALAARLGRAVNVAEAPLEAVVPTMKSAGMSDSAAEAFRDMYAALIAGHLVHHGPPAEQVKGTTSVADALLG